MENHKLHSSWHIALNLTILLDLKDMYVKTLQQAISFKEDLVFRFMQSSCLN